ncbi:alkyl sulfatase C-terminal domain-containing protein [Streptomyces collinus]|uniref:alkyl sulfatase C-terminal domain-containing protein n=1 Tax=Streptomyces collinus TaxID=42684 RepID=UPI00339FD225
MGTLAPADLAARETVKVTGDTERLGELFGKLSEPDPDFAIVTPRERRDPATFACRLLR